MHTKPGAIFILDSISQLCSHGRMTADIGDRYRDDVPLMLSSLTKRVSNILPINKSIVMNITANTLFPGIDGLGRSIKEMIGMQAVRIKKANMVSFDQKSSATDTGRRACKVCKP